MRRFLKHPRLLLPAIALLVLAMSSFIYFDLTRVRVTKAVCERISRGMTRAQVEAIIGGPADDYTIWIEYPPWQIPGFFTPPDAPIWSDWLGDEGVISVAFNHQGEVLEAGFTPADEQQPHKRQPAEAIRRLLPTRLRLRRDRAMWPCYSGCSS